MNISKPYQELLDNNQRLLAENEQLRKEVEHLKKLLAEKDSFEKQEKTKGEASDSEPAEYSYTCVEKGMALSLSEKVASFQSIFKGREDVFARRWYRRSDGKSGYQPVCLNEWKPRLCNKKQNKCTTCPNRQFKALTYDDLYRHLEGKSEDGCDVIGLYPVLTDNTCHFLCADFDDKQCTHGYQNDVLAFITVCKEWNIPCSVERSRSGNGAHVWIFFEEPLPAAKARRLGNTVLTEAMDKDGRMSLKSYDRIFPNQDRLPEGGFGNLIALPLQGRARKNGNSIFVNEAFIPFEDQWAYLVRIKKIPEQSVDELLALHGLPSELGDLSTTSESKPWEVPLPQKITAEDFPESMELIRANALYIPLAGLSGKALNHIKRIASFKNPEFYARQGMRLSTYNIPRVISCANILEEYITLPRGCEDALLDLLTDKQVAYRIEDRTNHGTGISVRFKGELREEQAAAVGSLIKHDNGVLNGTTAFGKTVTTIGLIAKRKRNTLILVHTKTLLDQWKTRLEEFLDMEYTEEELPRKRGGKKVFSPFGTLDSHGNTLHGRVDIALIQSCFDKEDVKPFVRDYGMVIVDECHHVSAVNFERILKQTNARYVYGLTATPIRKDGHQPIIFMQCGPIRYSANAKMQMGSQSFRRLFIPRFTFYRELTDEKQTYMQLTQKMTEDHLRNRLIAEDVRQALAEGRTPIVLTHLTSHVQVLSAMIADYCKNVITLVGSESAKGKRLKMECLQGIPPEEPLVIVATGKYVGEGFDYPRLDSLFLALPVSWKGIVAQYAGRLHREYPGKKEVRIYDYIDIRVPMCDVMYRRRLKGYASVGYKVQEKISNNLLDCSQDIIFNGKNVQESFLSNLSGASKSVVISTTKLWFAKHAPILEILAELVARGVKVIVFVRRTSEANDRLSNKGIRVNVKEKLSLHAAVIDKAVSWYGSVNYLGYNTEEDNAIRVADASLAEEMIRILYED